MLHRFATHSRSRRRPSPAVCLCLFLALSAAGATARAVTPSSVAAHYTTPSLSTQEKSAANLLNSDRARYGLKKLTLDPALCRLARVKAEDMRDNGYFAHVSPTYGDVRAMLRAFGYPFTAAAENIAHHATVDKAQAAFLSSPGHRRNLLSRTYTRVGIGVAVDARGFIYLTQIFCR